MDWEVLPDRLPDLTNFLSLTPRPNRQHEMALERIKEQHGGTLPSDLYHQTNHELMKMVEDLTGTRPGPRTSKATLVNRIERATLGDKRKSATAHISERPAKRGCRTTVSKGQADTWLCLRLWHLLLHVEHSDILFVCQVCPELFPGPDEVYAKIRCCLFGPPTHAQRVRKNVESDGHDLDLPKDDWEGDRYLQNEGLC